MRSARASVSVLAAGMLVLAGCSGTSDAPEPGPTPSAVEAPSPESPSDAEPTEDATAAASAGPLFPECEPGEGRTVTMLGTEVIEPQKIPEVVVEEFELDGQTVPPQVIEAVTIPERVIDRGCIIEHEAPGGCLGAVEISGALIPGYSLPARVLPEVTLPDGTVLEEVRVEGVGQEDVVIEGAVVDGVCQAEEGEPGTFVSAVYRPAVYRAAGYQAVSYQEVAYRPVQYLDAGTVPGASVPGVTVPGSTVPGESVEGAALEAYQLEGADDVEVTDKDEAVSYSSEGDVLFGDNDDEILPEAAAGLEAVVADIEDRGTPVGILVEGHTDDVGTEEHNLDLSQRRAEAVATWLVDDGGLDADLVTTIGHGFAHPRADNATDEGRAQNRRVVITIKFG